MADVLDPGREGPLRTISDLHRYQNYSDFTIACGESSYNVHKAVICPQSEFFGAAFRFPGREAKENCIKLPDDSPEMVERMVHFFYHSDYLPTTPIPLRKLLKNKQPAETEDQSTDSTAAEELTGDNSEREVDECPCVSTAVDLTPKWWTNDRHISLEVSLRLTLATHASMYALGDKYRIAGSKKQAKSKFEAALTGHSSVYCLRPAMPIVFGKTPDSDIRLSLVI